MRPSKIAGAGAAGIRAEQIAGAGHAQHRAGHRIEHALAVRVGDRECGRDRPAAPARSKNPSHCRWPAPCGWSRISSRSWWWRYRRSATSAPLTTRPWRGAGAGAAGKRLQQPRGAALGGGRKRVVADFDGPGALADRNARQRRLILRIQPALRGRRLRRRSDSRRAGAQAASSPQPSARAGAKSARWLVTEWRSLRSRAS